MYLLFMFLRPQVKKICLGISFCHGSHGIIRFWAWYRWDGLSISFYRMTHYKFLLCISIFFIVHSLNLALSLHFLPPIFWLMLFNLAYIAANLLWDPSRFILEFCCICICSVLVAIISLLLQITVLTLVFLFWLIY